MDEPSTEVSPTTSTRGVLQAQVRLLQELEWAADWGCCPVCRRDKDHGHHEHCRLANHLKLLRW